MKRIHILYTIIGFFCFFVFCIGCNKDKNRYTRGIGIYPGLPGEDFSPALEIEKDTYRNLAKNRAAFHSSSYDYNLTAQLVTDGIIEKDDPNRISVSTNLGILPKNEREWLLDHNQLTAISLEGSDGWIQVEFGSGSGGSEVTEIGIKGDLTYDENKKGKWQFTLLGSNDGEDWVELGRKGGVGFPGVEKPNPFARMGANRRSSGSDSTRRSRHPEPSGTMRPRSPDSSVASVPVFRFRRRDPERNITPTFSIAESPGFRFFRMKLSAACAKSWSVGDFVFYQNHTERKMAPSHTFKSAWMSSGNEKEWICVDLGAVCVVDSLALHWIRKAFSGYVEISDDGEKWMGITDLQGNGEIPGQIKLKTPVSGRYVRLSTNSSILGERVVLSEFEVFGTGGPVPVPKPSPKQVGENRIILSGGGWKIQRASLVHENGETISRKRYSDKEWLAATVPATVLTSYWKAGAIPDPNYGDNQLMISESFFNSDFWYRNEFEVPADFINEHAFLNFDGINWKADVYLNGAKAGRIEGAFARAKFDVTGLLRPGEINVLAVFLIKNENIGVVKEQTAVSPDKNGGVLGGDNPTYHASIGWDWIPTIRGRNMGIWNDVFLTTFGKVTLNHPFIVTDLPLPDTTLAEIRVGVTLKNHSGENVEGELTGKYGDIHFEQNVSLAGSETKTIWLDGTTHPELMMENPELWWPRGYGNPHLYEVELGFATASGLSDKTGFQSGIREMTYNTDDQVLKMYINGRRFIGRGGNWGFPESNLNYRNREYDIAVAYHADMNFTMIRNWVGQTGDEEFYEACDRHGIMVWQDFWLANPADGPDPYDPEMFLDNARDMVLRIRNHPSVGIYCGRNEGNPPEVLDTALRKLILEDHPGLFYISNSSQGVVSGGGPYRALPVASYYTLYGADKFHSERGMPNVMPFESLQQTLPEPAWWPQNSLWGLHDYCLNGAQGAASFNDLVERGFGTVNSAQQFTSLAQRINYDGYRGMFEARSPLRKGLLLWMSHPAWPSMVWQTYDYYFEPTAAYFGCKKASEPIHIQWNPTDDQVEVVNYHAGTRKHITAKAQLINMDGSVRWENEKELDSNEDSTVKCFSLEFPETLSSVHFIKLILLKGEKVLSENFYWRGLEDGNYQALNKLPKGALDTDTRVKKSGETWFLAIRLKNTSEYPVLMVRLKVEGKKSGERILPAFFSDNYLALMPGEEKTITIQCKDEDTRGEKPVVVLSGFNLETTPKNKK